MDKISTGALLDTRLDEQKQKDYLHEELASGVEAYKWEERPIQGRYYFPYNQASSLSCVAGGIAITREHFARARNIQFTPSRKDIYIRRINYPGGGMMMHDAFNIGIKGMTSEQSVKSQGLGEVLMNTQYNLTSLMNGERSANSFDNWVSIVNYNDIDTLASIVAHTPIVSFWFFDNNNQYGEWWKNQPQVVNSSLTVYSNDAARHQVAIVDAVLVGGKKCLVVQDTAGVGTGFGDDKNLRLITEEMLKARIYAAGYGIDKPQIPAPVKPVYTFLRPLKVGMRGKDVKALQEVLKYEGCITLNASTELFAGITLAGVKNLQKKYASEILTPVGLKLPTGFVGEMTLKFLNKKYGQL